MKRKIKYLIVQAYQKAYKNGDLPSVDLPEIVVEEFTHRFLDTELFYDKYAKGKFARYLLQRHQQGPVHADADSVHRLIDQAQLFIDAAYACYARCAIE